jgi:chemotaxis-related protein WspD
MTSLPLSRSGEPSRTESAARLAAPTGDCWTRIGVWGDRTCEVLPSVVHCHNCQVFTQAGRCFLDKASPPGYLQEWTRRLADPLEEEPGDLLGVVIFRLGGEWLALPVSVLVEVTSPRRVHRVSHRGGLLAGLVNIRGELHLCVHLDSVLGIARGEGREKRLLVVHRDGERWVFPVDEVDQVHRFPAATLTPPPATVGRALARLSRGLFHWRDRSIGLVDDARLFQALRGRIQ